MHASLRSRESRNRKNPSFLKGLLFGPDGHALTTSSTRRSGQQFRYYVSYTAQSKGYKNAPLPPLSATTVENMVLEETRKRLESPELLFSVWQQANQVDDAIDEQTVRTALNDLASIWDELFAPEKRRLITLLIKRIDLTMDQVIIHYQPEGMNAITRELQGAA